MSLSSIATTFPAVFKSSSLPSLTKLEGETNPEIESRSILRTMTFLCVEGMKFGGWQQNEWVRDRPIRSAVDLVPNFYIAQSFLVGFSHFSAKIREKARCSSQNINIVLFSLAFRKPSQEV